MTKATRPLAALATLALALSTGSQAFAGTTQGERAHSSQAHWAVVRVTLSKEGVVEEKHLAYQSGDDALSKAALVAVSKTRFVPDSHVALSSTFDYLLLEKSGKRSARILPGMPGDHQVSAAAHVHVPQQGNAWASNASERSISKI